MVSRLPERLGARRYKICERILSLMTANQIKLAAAIGFAALIPVAYQWKVRSSEDRSPNVPMSVQQVDLLDGTPKAAPVAPSSPTQSASPRKAVLEPRTQEDWQVRRFRNLVADLSDEEWQVRKEAARTLATYGEEANAAVPALIEVLRDEDWYLRNDSAMVLVSAPNKEAVPGLASVLADEEWHVAAYAATALGGIGPDAVESTPALLDALDHEQWHVRNGAAYALGAIGASSSVDLLRRNLQDEEPTVVKTAPEALASLEERP